MPKTPAKKGVKKTSDDFHIGKEMEALEQAIDAIESEDGDIDASIEQLTIAMEKAKLIRAHLKQAQLRVDELTSSDL